MTLTISPLRVYGKATQGRLSLWAGDHTTSCAMPLRVSVASLMPRDANQATTADDSGSNLGEGLVGDDSFLGEIGVAPGVV